MAHPLFTGDESATSHLGEINKRLAFYFSTFSFTFVVHVTSSPRGPWAEKKIAHKRKVTSQIGLTETRTTGVHIHRSIAINFDIEMLTHLAFT